MILHARIFTTMKEDEIFDRVVERLLSEARAMPKKLYHGSGSEMKIGTTIGGSGKKFRSNFGDVEKILEAFRPPEMESRLTGVYMVGRPSDAYTAGGSDAYVYEVQPLDEVQPHHFSWAGEVYDYAMDNADELTRKGPKLSRASLKAAIADPQVQRAALNYWNGVPPKSRKGEVWEYITTQARILRQVR